VKMIDIFTVSLLTLLTVAVLCTVYVLLHRLTDRTQRKSVTVLVLGDFGRSPRIQYHTLSLARANRDVHVVAYQESRPLKELQECKNVFLHDLIMPSALPAGLPQIAFVLYAPIKVVIQTLNLLSVLLIFTPPASHLLLQNPPAIPALPIAVIVCLLRNTALVVDWHNYGYSILALKLNSKHILVRLSKWIEQFFATWGSHHLCVTDAMRQDLQEHWRVMAHTLHDRPAAIFQPVSIDVTHTLFQRLQKENPTLKQGTAQANLHDNATLLTVADGNKITFRTGRPAVIVSSTSWTPDEDFGLLYAALEAYEAGFSKSSTTSSLPDILCIITGKGPMRAHYESLVAKAKFQHITIAMAWLAMEDYPKLLASADLGISLHTSSSGLDLPMKVVDMFGCCLPVCSVNFRCVHELVQDNVNGKVFDTAPQLAQQLAAFFKDFPTCTELNQYRSVLRDFRKQDWQTNWQSIAAPLFTR